MLIDHPKVIDVLHEIIGPEIRLEAAGCVWRKKGQSHGELHGGGPRQIDPIFGYRVQNGRIHAGMVRVIFELSGVNKGDGGTHFIVGSHKANFPMHEAHLSLKEGRRSPFLMTYECPAGQRTIFYGKCVSRRSCVATGYAPGDDFARVFAFGDALASVEYSASGAGKFTPRKTGLFQAAVDCGF